MSVASSLFYFSLYIFKALVSDLGWYNEMSTLSGFVPQI